MSTYVTVEHVHYGCDTGCCGHDINLWDETGVIEHEFEFTHPYGEDYEIFAKELAAEYFPAAELNFKESYIVND